MKDVEFHCCVKEKSFPLPHFWEHTVGSGRALLALRADWQAQLKRCHEELGFRHVRFHGWLNDDMGTFVVEDDQLVCSFFNADQICDFLLSIGMRPFVELSFMPKLLASGPDTVFKYAANVTPPNDYNRWGQLIGKLLRHWVERYGLEEIRNWYFEVWNEPNEEGFWKGSQEDYFKLYQITAKAVKAVDSKIRVGGPTTANDAWIPEFLSFCDKNEVPIDFVTTHHYPTDAVGTPGQDTETELSESTRSILRDRARKTHKQVGGKPLYYTEWSTSSNPRDPLHDEPYAAAVVVKTMMEARGLTEGYSYWTFSDIFEENYMPGEAFQGGFGLLTLQGVAKPAYRAFELLHRLGEDMLPVDGWHETVDVWAVRGENCVVVLATNFALPEHPIAAEKIQIRLEGLDKPSAVYLEQIDEQHANAKRIWVEMGAPPTPSKRQVEELKAASYLQRESVDWKYETGVLSIELTLPAQSVASFTVELSTKSQSLRKSEDFLSVLQKEAFTYFLHEANPSNGLVPDRSCPDSPACITAVGMALSCYPVAIERGFMSKSAAIKRTLNTLHFFRNSTQSGKPNATGYKGLYYHFLNMKTGERYPHSEISTIDTALLFAGVLTAASYFEGSGSKETEIRDLAQELYGRVNWKWAQVDSSDVSMGWQPGKGFLPYVWQGYDEALILFVLGLGSESGLDPRSYAKWTSTFDWRKIYDQELVHSAPLFTHQMSHCWIDLHGIRDEFMRNQGIDYFENSRRATYVQRRYAIENPQDFKGYGENCWGITASDGPGWVSRTIDGRVRQFYGYDARGVPEGPDDGTISPWSTVASLPFAPEIVMPAMENFERMKLRESNPYGLKASFNQTFVTEGSDPNGYWVSPNHFGLNQGPVVLMIENYRSEMIWNLLRNSPPIVKGLKRAGFDGGWLDSSSD